MNRLWNFNLQIVFKSEKAVYLQIADAIINAIKTKRLKSGDVLPSTRKLSEIIGVNRNTITKALDILITEGWLVSKERIGIFVADITIQNDKKKKKVKNTSFSNRPAIYLDDGIPNTQIAPIKELASAYRRAFSLKSKRNILGYINSTGSIEIRDVISQMLNHKRGMHTDADEICITRGSQMALYLVAHCLVKPKDFVLVENPGYQPAWEAFKSAGANLIPVKVDKEGVLVKEVEELVKKNSNIKAIYVTPHHQYPTAVTLSLKRRLKLIELSNRYNFTIVEDDYDHEFHFDNRPMLPISSYSNLKNYVYIGTFSKIVAPSLRLGYLACNIDLIQKISSLREIIDVQSDSIMEQAIVELVKNGDVRRHVKRASKYYREKRTYFEMLLKTHLKGKVIYTVPSGGLAFWISPIADVSIPHLLASLRESGIHVTDSSKYTFKEPINGFRMGYGSIDKDGLEKVVIKLGELL